MREPCSTKEETSSVNRFKELVALRRYSNRAEPPLFEQDSTNKTGGEVFAPRFMYVKKKYYAPASLFA